MVMESLLGVDEPSPPLPAGMAMLLTKSGNSINGFDLPTQDNDVKTYI